MTIFLLSDNNTFAGEPLDTFVEPLSVVVRQQHLRRRAARHLRRAADFAEIAEIVIDLFLLTTKMDMNCVKKSVFGIKDDALIVDNKHPAILELFRIYNGPGNCPV